MTNAASTIEADANRPPLRLIRLPDVMALTGLARPTIYRGIANKRFPPAIKAGSASLWIAGEVEAWIRERIAESRGGE